MHRLKVNHKQVIELLMEQKKPKKAIEDLLLQTAGQSPKQIQRAFINIRAKILRTKRYKNNLEWQRLLQFCQEKEITESEDIHLLRNVIPNMTVSNFHWFQKVGFNSCKSYQLFSELCEFRIMNDPFYDFDCPPDIKYASNVQHQQDIQTHNCHEKEDRTLYHLSQEEIEEMIQTAKSTINAENTNWDSRGNHIRLLEALCLVTGRRKWELCSTLQMRSSPVSDYQAEIQGVCKHMKKNNIWISIPLLLPIAEVAKGIVNLRRYTKIIKGRYNGPRLFKRKMTHTHLRNVFADQAFRERETKNLFYINDKSVGPIMWKSLALAIKMKTAAEHYSVMCTDHVSISTGIGDN